MDFHDLKVAVSKRFTLMAEHKLFTSKASKDDLWDTYLGAFPEGTNPIYRERTEHDCNCCKQFIRAAGNVLAIIDGELVSVWDIEMDDEYQIVADAMSALVKSKGIDSVFLHSEGSVGTDKTLASEEGGVITYNHFHQVLPRSVVFTDGSIGTKKGSAKSNQAVLKRSLNEISMESIDIVIELINQNSIYRGAEHISTIRALTKAKVDYAEAKDPELFLWLKSVELGRNGGFRNTVIGTLLTDISEGIGLEKAVKMFEAKVAPENYKRPTALVTQGMIKQAQEKVAELGLEDALPRRYAVVEDVTINNVLFADRSAKEAMGVFGEMAKEVKGKLPNLDRVEEVSIETFLSTILPKADSLEVLVDNKHVNNFVSLVAPINPEANSILKWGNNFTWSYNGEVADSMMKENVKKAGGKVDGLMRFSLQWNEEGLDNTDLDAHAFEPSGNEIYYGNQGNSARNGHLDVDIQHPGSRVAVENITWATGNNLTNGVYSLKVKDYSGRGTKKGFRAELELDGVVHSFDVPKMNARGFVEVAKVRVTKDTSGNVSFEVLSSLESSIQSRDVWGVPTQKFQKVNLVLNSPNHWNEEATGNKHTFFIIEDCLNPEGTRGFYNEQLRNDLTEHRKVFEVLGSKLKVPESDNQLSGLGFSSTVRNQVVVKVSGSFNRIVKVNF